MNDLVDITDSTVLGRVTNATDMTHKCSHGYRLVDQNEFIDLTKSIDFVYPTDCTDLREITVLAAPTYLSRVVDLN